MTELFEKHVGRYHRSGDQAYGLCPFHDDKSASLSIHVITGLWNCKACSAKGNFDKFKEMVDGVRFIAEKVSAPVQPPTPPPKLIVKEVYRYEDASGKMLYEIIRMEPKSFRVRSASLNGEWVYSCKDVQMVPYNLPKILIETNVFLVEGEGKANLLMSKGLTATTTPFGASSWKTHYAEWFKNKNVIILPDNDHPGEKYALQAAKDLVKIEACRVKIVKLPLREEGDDAKEYFEKYGGTIEDLFELIQATPVFSPKKDIPIDKWFREQGIEIPSSAGVMPHEFKSLCKKAWNACIERFNCLDDSTMIFIDSIDIVWASARTEEDYFRFLIELKKLVEYQSKVI